MGYHIPVVRGVRCLVREFFLISTSLHRARVKEHSPRRSPFSSLPREANADNSDSAIGCSAHHRRVDLIAMRLICDQPAVRIIVGDTKAPAERPAAVLRRAQPAPIEHLKLDRQSAWVDDWMKDVCSP